MAVRAVPPETGHISVHYTDRIVELVGRRAQAPRIPDQSADAIVELQVHAVGQLVEIIELRGIVEEREAHISALASGLRTWRERALAEKGIRGAEREHLQEREAELVSELHQQVLRVQELEETLARIRRRHWWQRIASSG